MMRRILNEQENAIFVAKNTAMKISVSGTIVMSEENIEVLSTKIVILNCVLIQKNSRSLSSFII